MRDASRPKLLAYFPRTERTHQRPHQGTDESNCHSSAFALGAKMEELDQGINRA